MNGRNFALTFTVACIALFASYKEGHPHAFVLWAAFFICLKLDSVIAAIERRRPAE